MILFLGLSFKYHLLLFCFHCSKNIHPKPQPFTFSTCSLTTAQQNSRKTPRKPPRITAKPENREPHKTRNPRTALVLFCFHCSKKFTVILTIIMFFHSDIALKMKLFLFGLSFSYSQVSDMNMVKKGLTRNHFLLIYKDSFSVTEYKLY